MKYNTLVRISICITCIVISTITVSSQTVETNVRHMKVYHEPGRYAGWPANHGIWIWGNEILVGFSKGYHKDLGSKHNIDREKVVIHVLARSENGGESWNIEDPAKNGLLSFSSFGIARTDFLSQPIGKLDSKINFTHPGFAMTARMGEGDHSIFWFSYDKGHHWKGPYELPLFGTSGTMARTDYLVNSKNEALLFLTVQKKDKKEGRMMCVKTTDGGVNWSFLSWIGTEPTGYDIMPASVRLSKNEILVTSRTMENKSSFISTYISRDNGKSWKFQGKAAEDTGIGNPPALVKMKDGRICMVYGYRSDPERGTTSDIRAKISNDKGKTWGKDYILRNDGSGRDIGYPRIVERPDGKIVAVYYFMDKETGPERYIGASIWSPPSLK